MYKIEGQNQKKSICRFWLKFEREKEEKEKFCHSELRLSHDSKRKNNPTELHVCSTVATQRVEILERKAILPY